MVALRARQILGNLAYWERHRNRIVDAVGSGVCKFVDTYVGSPMSGADALSAYTVTLVEEGDGETTVALADAIGGGLLITTDDAENDGANLQVKGTAFQFTAGKPLYFGIQFQVSEATQSDFLVGLAVTDTDALGGLTDGVYFRKVDGAAAVSLVLEKDSTETAGAVHTAADDIVMTLELFWDGASLDSYVDGVAQDRLALTNLPDDETLTPTIHFLTGAASSETMQVDWLRCIQFVA